jgi:hypothetical protein
LLMAQRQSLLMSPMALTKQQGRIEHRGQLHCS